MMMRDLDKRRYELGEAITEHDRLARQAGGSWYDRPAVISSYARVKAAYHSLDPWTLAGDYGAAHELEFYGGDK